MTQEELIVAEAIAEKLDKRLLYGEQGMPVNESYELMGYIHGRHSGPIGYSVEEKILDYYIEIELSYYACDVDPNHLRLAGELTPFAKYRVYIY